MLSGLSMAMLVDCLLVDYGFLTLFWCKMPSIINNSIWNGESFYAVNSCLP